MSYDLGLQLARMPLETAIPLFVAMGLLLSLIGVWLVNSVFTPFQLEANNLVGGVKFGFLGEVYAVTLALALLGAFDHYTSAQTNAQREASTLIALKRAASAYSEPNQTAERSAMERTVKAYARAVVEKEWRVMSYGIADAEASLRLADMTDAFIKADPLTAGQQAVQQNTVEWVRQVNEFRSFRLTTVSRSLIALVWVVLITGTLTAIVFPWFFGNINIVAQSLMSGLLVSFLMLHLLMVLQLAYPFVGDTSVSPDAFLQAAQ